MDYCTHCGNKIKAGEKFCAVCGNKIRTIKEDLPNTDSKKKQRVSFGKWYIYNWNRCFCSNWKGAELLHHLLWLIFHIVIIVAITTAITMIVSQQSNGSHVLSDSLDRHKDASVVTEGLSDLIEEEAVDESTNEEAISDAKNELQGIIMLPVKMEKTSRDEKNSIVEYSIVEYKYDSFGRKIEEIYDIDAGYAEFEYDSEGNLIKEIHRKVDMDNYDIEYDTYGNKTKYVLYESDGSLISTEQIVYDDHGNVIRDELSYQHGGGRINEYENEYDSIGRLEKSTNIQDNTLLSYSTYEYDEYDNMILEKKWNAAGESEGTVEKEYDSNGNMIASYSHNPEGKTTDSYVLEYDDRGNLIRKDIIVGSETVYKTEQQFEFEYDEYDNMVKQIYVNSGEGYRNELTTEYKYEYQSFSIE